MREAIKRLLDRGYADGAVDYSGVEVMGKCWASVTPLVLQKIPGLFGL